MWVPAEWVAAGMTGLPGTDVEIVPVEDGTTPPASVADVEFYVPSFFPTVASGEVMRLMKRLRVVQTLTAGVDRLQPYVPDGAVLCNARGASSRCSPGSRRRAGGPTSLRTSWPRRRC